MRKKSIVSIMLIASFVSALYTNDYYVYADEIDTEETAVSEEEQANEEAESNIEEEVEDTRIIPDGISIASIDVGGMTVSEADDIVDEYVTKELNIEC